MPTCDPTAEDLRRLLSFSLVDPEEGAALDSRYWCINYLSHLQLTCLDDARKIRGETSSEVLCHLRSLTPT